MAQSNEKLTPRLCSELVEAIKKNPHLVDVADECGVSPRDLQMWIRRGMYPQPDPLCRALAGAARKSRALLRGKLWQTLATAAENDPRWAQYVWEELKEEGEIKWQDTLPSEGEAPLVRQHLLANPNPELQQDLDACNYLKLPAEISARAVAELVRTGKLQELVGELPALPPPIAEGELIDEI